MGALSFADDITIMCPIIGGLNEIRFVTTLLKVIVLYSTIKKLFVSSLEGKLLKMKNLC